MALAATDRTLPTLSPPAFRLPVPMGSTLDEGFVAAAWDAARQLPEAVRAALVAFRSDPGADGALLLRGLRVGSVPATPSHPGRAPARTAGAS